MRAHTKILIAILFIAAFLRLWGLTRGDPVNDEVLMGFRSIGLIDFDLAEFQTTPWEWFDPKIPWWAGLSWHDHPPLVFYIQHLSFVLFGENLFALRFPSALLGIISVYLVYLLGKTLTSREKLRLLAFLPSFVSMPANWQAGRGNREKIPPSYEGGGIKGGGSEPSSTAFQPWHQGYNPSGKKTRSSTGSHSWLPVGLGESKCVALLAAALYAITLNAVYISRTGMQESYAIFFILFSCYLFLRALEHPRYFLWTGVAMGVGFLAKYTVLFFTAPLFFLYLLVFYRSAFRQKNIWLGASIVLLFATPIIIYNTMLYRAVGHFDFQFSALFFQDHPAWQVQPGKDIGSVGDRISRFVPNLIATHSWLFLTLAGLAIIGFCISLFRNPRVTIYRHSFLIFALGTMFLLLLGIGPSFRFLTMLTPFLALTVGAMANHTSTLAFLARPSAARSGFRPPLVPLTRDTKPASGSKPARVLMWFAFAVIVLFEIFYSWNNQIAYYPIGSPLTTDPWLFSKARYENYNWGYNELARYFEDEFRGKVPEITFDLQYQFLEQLRDRALDRGVDRGRMLYPALVVTYGNFDKGGKLWALDRLHIYHAWPIINLATYYDYMRERGDDYYARSGFKYFYFVIPTNTVAAPEFSARVRGIDPIAIKNPRGDTAFLVYKMLDDI